MTFKPSEYQQNIFRFVSNAQGDGVVDAVAGSGKTTTLVQAAKLLNSESVFIAFNKHVVDTLRVRLAGTQMEAKTIHGIGMGCLHKMLEEIRVDDYKYDRLARNWIGQNIPNIKSSEIQDLSRSLSEMVRLCRLTLTNADNSVDLAQMVVKYHLDLTPNLFGAVPIIIKQGEEIALLGKVIDFADQLWLPFQWDLRPRTAQWVFVDEAQDLSAAALHLILKLRKPGGRMLFVGDPNQAIYGFAGADARSFQEIKNKTKAVELPLSICYRCPTSHLALARELVPRIEPRPNAPSGLVEYVKEFDFPKIVRSGDLILSRKTLPLVSWCIYLIQHGISAQIRGKDLGKDLSDLARRIARQIDFSFEEFDVCTDIYEQKQVSRLSKREGTAAQIESLRDRCDALRACFEAFQNCTFEEFCDRVEALFSDERPSIWLSTVHRAKGLEQQRVFLLRPNDLPLKWTGQQAWELEQEFNLKYVALTRSTSDLYIMGERPPKK